MKCIEGIWIPSEDEHFPNLLRVSPKVHGKATYQLKKYHAALKHVKHRGLAVDIGGHVGLWARVMSYDFERVISFEPLQEHRACFIKNLEGRQNVELFGYALADKQTALNIHMPADNTGHAHTSADTQGTRVNAVPLDALEFPQRIDFLKIDVEGFETYVVRGAETTIRYHKPVIIIEQKPNGNAERYGLHQHEAVRLLRSWGMKDDAVMAGDHIMVWE